MGKLIGTRGFYKKVMLLALPVMIQNAITSFVALLDNIMVGQIGTDPMSGVSIVNQLMFVFNVTVFGGLAGAGIFCAEYFGKGDEEGVHYSFRFKMYASLIIVTVGTLIFLFWGDELISLYLHSGSSAGNIDATREFGKSYLKIILLGLLPFAIGQAYTSTLRECGRTTLPLVAGIAAVVTNMSLNYVLIFGKFGAPKLGSDGAAIATVVARYVECFVIIVVTHLRKAQNPFAAGFYKSLRIPKRVVVKFTSKSIPLLINEVLWSMNVAIVAQCYSYRGLATVAAVNITSTITNIFNIVFLALGSVVTIIIGQLLGANKIKEAIEKNRQLLFFTTAVSAVLGAIMILFANTFPSLYNTEEEVKALATAFIVISSISLAFHAYNHSGYFTIRSGGKTRLVLLTDVGYTYLIVIPTAFVFSRFTNVSPITLFTIVQIADALKCIVVYLFVKSGKWARNIVDNID